MGFYSSIDTQKPTTILLSCGWTSTSQLTLDIFGFIDARRRDTVMYQAMLLCIVVLRIVSYVSRYVMYC